MSNKHTIKISPVPFNRKVFPSGREGKRHTRTGPVDVPTLGQRVPPLPRRKSEGFDTKMFVGAEPQPMLEFIASQGFDVAQVLAEGFNVLSERRAFAENDPDPLSRAVRDARLSTEAANRLKGLLGGSYRTLEILGMVKNVDEFLSKPVGELLHHTAKAADGPDPETPKRGRRAKRE